MAKKLGFGMMRLPLLNKDDPTSIDLEQTKQMVDSFIEQGFTYFDTAWMYHAFQSENAVKEVLMSRHERSTFTLATKLHAAFMKEQADRDRIFDEQKRKTGAEYFDYYLLHDMRPEHYKIYEDYDCFRWLADKKAKGEVKHMGFSFHSTPEFLDQVLTEHPEMEFVQLQINYLDWDSMDVQSGKCYEVAVKHGVPVIVMEPVKGGTLANVPERVEQMFKANHADWSMPSWAIRFVASLDNVMMVLSGMSDLAQLQDNTGYMKDFQPLTEKEQEIVRRAAEMIRGNITIPCTGCSYCTDGCPMNIAIPKYFKCYNVEMQKEKDAAWTSQKPVYAELTESFGKASDCLACGQCEEICPQSLPIISDLQKVAELFEN